MSPLLDNVLVAAALAASAVYALFKLGPSALRRALLSRIAGLAAHAPGWCGLRGVAARLGAAAVKSSGSCGGCDNCGSEGGAAQASPPASRSAGASAGRSGSGSEIRVPLARIGRRER